MADTDIVQVIAEARVDARSLSEFVFKPANFTVTRRLAPSVRTLQYYIDIFDNLDAVLSSSVIAAQKSLNSSVAEAQGKVGYIESTVQNAINNTAIEGGVLADTFLTATAYHPDTYARTQRSIRADTVSMLDFIPLDLHEGIKAYTYAVDLKAYIQKAIDYCVLNNKKLNVPAGGYLIDSAYVPIYLINHWGADKNLIIEGAGLGLTVFKEADGAVNRGGRFTKMLHVAYGSTSFVASFGHIKIANITFDKNASGEVAGSVLYEYEQAHIIGFGGSGTVDFKSMELHNVEFKDKVGGGFNMSSAPNVKFRKVLCSNVYSRNHPKVTSSGNNIGDGTFGQRGCLEFGTNIDTLDLVNCDVIYAQIEPVIVSSPTLQRYANVSGGKIDAFEWTDKGGYSFANVTNLTCDDKFVVRGINANVSNSTLKIRDVLAGGIIKISGGSIAVPYNADTNTVTPLVHGAASGYVTDYSELWLTDVTLNIDSADPSILPLGYILTGGASGTSEIRKRFITNVKFDPRGERSIDAYANGDWKISNCDLYGTLYHVQVGGATELRSGNVELINNSYLGSGTVVNIAKNNQRWSLKVSGTYPADKFYALVGADTYSNLVKQKPILYSATKPTTGSYPKGQVVINTNPVAGGFEKWIRTDEATAIWKGVGLIEGAATSGTTAQRPTGVAVGYTYFDTTLGKPVYFKSAGVWVDSAGATV